MLEEKFLNIDSENIEENIDQIAIKYMLNSFDKNKPHGDYNTINKFIKLLYLVKNDLKKNYMEAMNSRIHLNYSRIYGEYYYKSFPFIGNIITVDDISVIINKDESFNLTDSNTNIESLYNQALSYRNKFAFASYLFLGTFDKELLEKIYEQLDVTKREYEKQVASYLKTRKNKTNIDICLVKRQSLDEIIEVEKMCFYECQNVCFNPYKLTQISKRLHLSLKDLMEKVESYYSYLCSINSSSINSFLLNYQKNSIKTKFSNAISLAKIEEDGKLYEEHAYFKKIHEMPIETAMQLLLFKYGFNPSKIFEDYNLKIAKIDSYINTTLKNVREETQQNIITDILEKEIKFAIDVCAITGNGLEDGSNLVLDAIKNLVEEYVNGDYISKKDFCFRKKISISIFNSCLKYTEKYLPEIYQLYNNKNKKEENVRYAIVKNKTDKIVKLIKQGIELPDGSIRAFTITDYFFITSLTKEEFMNLSGNLSISDKRLIVPFFKKIADAPKVIVSNELKETTKYIYNINGALYEATEEDKISVLDYMKKNNLPLLTPIYRDLLRKQVFNELNDEVVKKPIMKIMKMN